MFSVTFNEKKNGIELRFDTKPEQRVLDMLHEAGFHWSGKQRIWFAKRTDERDEMVDRITKEIGHECPYADNSSFMQTNKTRKEVYDLWEMTRISDDVNNVDKSLTTKEIAAIIRKHIKSRFPMCKFSVRTESRQSISVELVAGPFEKESDELNAIIHYAYKYADSYNYCTCYDPYGDYGSSYNFYGVYENHILAYDYNQTEMTDEYLEMSRDFQQRKEAFDIAEAARKRSEREEYAKQLAIERAEAAEREKQHMAEHKEIEDGATVVPVNYFVLHLKAAKQNKNDSMSVYEEECMEEGKWDYINSHVCKEIHFEKALYEKFAAAHLLDDFDFIIGTGGTRTDDWRIISAIDFDYMEDDEQKTVEYYSYNTIAVYCEKKLMCVVDAQGHSYCRYVFLPCENTVVVGEYEPKQVLTVEQRDFYKMRAESLEDASAEVIINNDLNGTWNTTNFAKYKKLLVAWMNDNKFTFDVSIVRAIEDNTLKAALYRILTECDGIQEQFADAELAYNQKITIVRFMEFGGISATKAFYREYQNGRYAQYDNAVKLIIQPEKKKGEHYCWLYKEVLIYDGWLDIPEELFWDVSISASGLVCKKSKYLSFDKKQFDVVINHFVNNGKMPIINTYKPVF